MSTRILVFLAMAAGAYAQSAAFQWIRQIGGSQGQSIAGMATDSQGDIYVAGNTGSVDFPTKSAAQAKPGGSGLYRIDAPGAQLQNLYSSGLSSVTALSADPRNTNTLYAAGAQGLFRTIDAGATWSNLGSFAVPVYTVAVDPSASNVLYAGTSAEGIFKSTDGGATWTAINNGILRGGNGMLVVYHVWIDPASLMLFASAAQGLVRSSDGGATWQTNSLIEQDPALLDIAFDPNTPGLVYAATLTNLFKSADDGITWTPLMPPVQNFEPRYVLADPKRSGTVYTAGLVNGLWVSTDGGNTWTNKYPQYPSGLGPLTADPVSGAVYLVAGGNLFMSTDGFDTAAPVGTVSSATNVMVVAGTHLFVGVQASSDVFVAKLDAQGNTIYATYFGGTGTDEATGMAVDAGGSVYVTGITTSADFPVSPGAFAKTGGNFVFKLNGDGSVSYSTYFSSTSSTPNAIAVDGAGHAYIAGTTFGGLPVTAGAYQKTLAGANPCCTIGIGPPIPPATNAFLAEFDAAGASLVFSTYVGNQNAFAQVLALAPDGNAILAGAYALCRVAGDGSALLNSGSLPGVIWALTADSAGNIYAGGLANSTSPPFPTTAGAFQTAPLAVPSLPGTLGNTGGGDAFVTKLDSQFKILASTLLGGEAQDETLALAIAANGNVLAAGSTYSKAFPVRGAAQGSFSAATGFVTELTPDLSSAVVSTFAGDTRVFNVGAIAPTADGGLLFAGATASAPFFQGEVFSAPGGVFPAPTIQGFVVKVGINAAAPRVDTAVNAASQLSVPLAPGGIFQIRGDGFGSDAVLLVNGNAVPLLSQSHTALTAMLPADFNALGSATVVVQSGGGFSNPLLTPVTAAAPGVYSVDGTGLGQGYILNQDGSLNSPANPANEGAPITICATGVGPLTFAGGYAVAASPVSVYIDGFYANGIAATLGPRAGLAGNVYQISVYVPKPSNYAASNTNLQNFVMPPSVAVTLEVNGSKSQAGLALSVSH